MAKKLNDAIAEAKESAEARKPARKVTTDEAAVLAKLAMSGADDNQKSRFVMTVYLEGLLSGGEVEDDDAKAAIAILGQASTENHKKLCNKVIGKYLGKFDALLPKPIEAKPVAKEPVAA